jgi:hypothetical protein
VYTGNDAIMGDDIIMSRKMIMGNGITEEDHPPTSQD